MLIPQSHKRARRRASAPARRQRRHRSLRLEPLEPRLLLAAVPMTALSVPNEAMLGEQFSLGVEFWNDSLTDPGYGPFVDLQLPATGVDGAGAEPDDGITFVGATYLSQSVTSTIVTFDSQGEAPHPLARNSSGNPVIVTGTPGDQLVVLELPFGSYTPGQPRASLDVTVDLSQLADAGIPLDIQTRGGFRFGNDPLDNPASDPSLIETPTHQSAVSPIVYRLRKTYSGPENETATGPNYLRQYTVTADVADGVTLTNLELTDVLPANLQFVQVDSTTIHGAPATANALSTPDTATAGGNLTRQFPSVTGTAGANDAAMVFTFHVPRTDAGASNVLNPNTGDDVNSANEANSLANWTPDDSRDPPTIVTVNSPGPEHTLTDKSIAIQKSASVLLDVGAPGASPGDTIQYELMFQLSDFFSFGDLQITDIFSDGQRLDSGFAPTFAITDRSGAVSGSFTDSGPTPDLTIDLARIGNDSNPATDGSTRLVFDVSQTLINAGQLDGILQGGRTVAPDQGAAEGTIRFRTVIQEQFSDSYLPNTPNVSEGDVLTNQVTIAGSIRDNNDLSSILGTEEDTSGATLSVIVGTLGKTVHAVNGNTTVASPILVAPGDEVTYRLTYNLPMTDFDGLSLTDYLPLPIFDATTLTTFDPAAGATPPPAGTLTVGPGDTFHAKTGLAPSLTTNAVANSFTITYGQFDDPTSTPSTLDLLATFTVSSNPFTDQLLLTNMARVGQDTTNAPDLVIDATVQLTLTEPFLQLSKGAVATDRVGASFSPATVGPVTFSPPGSPGTRFSGTIHSTNLAASPIESDLVGIDAGDAVTFAIVVENTGTGLNGAFDVFVRDTLPPEFSIAPAGLNLTITDGTGAPLPHADLGGGLFGSGIEFVDPSLVGAVAPYHATNGRNIVVITYDLVAQGSVAPQSILTNTATLFHYAGLEGAADHTLQDLEQSVDVTIASPETAKTVTSTAIVAPGNSATQAVIGELVTYDLTITVPEGTTPSATIVDTLDEGLAFVDLVGIASSNPAEVTWLGPATPVVTNSGHTVTIDFGSIINDNRVNEIAETITLTYRAVVLNVAGNQQATELNNSARFSWTGGSVPAVSANNITVVEPALTMSKSVTVGASGTIGDAEDAVAYVVTLRNNGPVDAFDVTFSDTLPSRAGVGSLIVGPGFAVSDSAAIVTAADFELIGDDALGWTLQTRPGVSFDMPAGGARTITITINGSLPLGVQPAEVIENQAETRFSSLDGQPGVLSPHNADATERTGTDGPGGALNDYATVAAVSLRIHDPTPAKSLVSSSETSSTGSNVAIGEMVRYRLVSRLAESTAPAFELVDQLALGLRVLDDGTATVALVSNDGGISSSTLSGAGLALNGNETNVDSLTPTFVLPSSAISGDPFSSGTDPTFQLGTLTNTDNDADQEFVIIEFNALIENTAGNQRGTTLNNRASARVDGSQAGSNSNLVSVSIVEPSITDVTKTALPTTGDSGDRIAYQVTYSNTNTANSTVAFDAQLTDTVPSDLVLDVASVNVTLGGGASGVTNNTSGNTVAVVIASLPPGGTVQLRYEATLQATVQPEQIVTNTATLSYTSLPGGGTVPNPTGSVTPGPDGSVTGQRDGSGGINNYVDGDSASVTITEPTVSKIVLTTNQLSTSGNNVLIGEHVQYELTFSVVEGTSNSVTVTDQFPAGMALISLDTITISPDVTTSVPGGFAAALATANVSAGGDQFIIDLETLTNDDRDNATTETVTISFTAVVLNGLANQDGANLVNTATVGYASGQVTATAPDVFVVEPALAVDKSPSAGEADAGGAPITYTVSISHASASSADASDVTVQDVLPAELTYVANSLAYVSGTVPNSLTIVGGSISATFDTLALGQDSTFRFDAMLNDAALPGQTIANTVDVRHTSLPGLVTSPQSSYSPVSTERTGNPSDPGGVLNDYLTAHAGNVTVRSNSVAGFVYSDLNNNANRDIGENGIQSVSLTLIGTDNLGNAVSRTTATALDGSYAFTDLRPGSYQIAAAQPPGYLDGDESVGTQGGTASNDRIDMVLPVGTTTDGTENNFGELLPSDIMGTVFRDLNNDGSQQPSENGINGVTMQLTGTDDRGNPVALSMQTQGIGTFAFGDLRPGTYTLTEVQPSGYLDGKGTVGTQGGTLGDDVISAITLTPGTTGTDNRFGELPPASISGTVYEDVNNDGAAETGESGISGVIIRLTGTDDLGQSVDQSTISAADGTYAFTDLRPGTYAVDETQPASPFYFDGIDTAGSHGGIVSNDQIVGVSISAEDTAIGYLFGELPPADPVGYVYVDANTNGIRDPSEPGIPGVQIIVTGTDDLGQNVTLNALTDTNGRYQFQFLRAGTYRISEVQPAGYIDGQEQNGTPSATVGNDFFDGLALTWGQFAGDYNFGELAFGSLSGRVYVDMNQDGQPGLLEPGIANVPITLGGTDVGGNPVSLTTTTAADGSYAFADLVPGQYRLQETQPASYLDGLDRVGSLGGVLQPDAVDQIFLAVNDSGTDYDFGEDGLLPELLSKRLLLARNRGV